MAKKGLSLKTSGSLLRDICSKQGWSLCIGAGTSKPMFVDWKGLVEYLVTLDVGIDKAPSLTKELLTSYSPDALIQASQDRLNCSPEEFFKILSEALYNNLQNTLMKKEWDLFTQMLSADPGEYERKKWDSYLKIIQKYFPKLSALDIAKVISQTLGTDIAPKAIMSFNAEPVLLSLLNANVLINQKENTDNNESKKKQFDLVTHSISDRKSGRIPYYFIHGLLPIPSNVKKRKLIESTDKLIFSESEYLQLANSVFSWQSSVFLEVSSTTSIVFIGVSLSDTNMRRWLSWIHKNRINELELKHSYSGASTTHYWLTVAPSSVDEKAWIESSVDYLGVRIIWLDSWDQIGEALRLMLGITDI